MLHTNQQSPFDFVDRRDYHADFSRVGSSMLRAFLRSPTEYAARYVTRDIAGPQPTADMRFGTAVHLAALEPDRFAACVAELPVVDMRTKEGRAKWAEFEGSAVGKIALSAENISRAKLMATAVRESAWWRANVSDGARSGVEWCCYWEDHVPCKALFDLVLPDAGCVVDLKTTSDPTPEYFAAEIWRRGYHVQAAHYLAGAYHEFGRLFRFVLLAAGKEPPYEVIPYEISPLHLEAVFAIRAVALADIARRMESGNWQRDDNANPVVVGLPKWVLKGGDAWPV